MGDESRHEFEGYRRDLFGFPQRTLEQQRRSNRRQASRLLVDVARAREMDPETSHRAARNVRLSDGLRVTQWICLFAVMRTPGLTAAELGYSLQRRRYFVRISHAQVVLKKPTAEEWRHEVSRRLPELELKGLVIRGTSRRCSVKHTKQATWSARSRAEISQRLEEIARAGRGRGSKYQQFVAGGGA